MNTECFVGCAYCYKDCNVVNFIKPPVPSISFDANKTCKIINIQLFTNKDTIVSKCHFRRVMVWIFGSHQRYCFAKAHEFKSCFHVDLLISLTPNGKLRCLFPSFIPSI